MAHVHIQFGADIVLDYSVQECARECKNEGIGLGCGWPRYVAFFVGGKRNVFFVSGFMLSFNECPVFII